MVIVRVTGMVRGLLVAPVPVTVIVALYVPVLSPLLLTETVSVEGAVPLLGLRESQEAFSEADHDNVPPPVFVMDTVFDDGFEPYLVAEKLREVGLRPIVGAVVMVKVTGMVLGLLVAPEALTVIVPVYVPTARPEILTDAASVEGAVPLLGLRESHEASSEADHARVPPPVLVMETFCEDGLELPCTAVKLNEVGLNPIAGGGLTVRVTEMLRGLLLAPVALTVIVPL